MALGKEIVNDMGLSSNYWIVSRIEKDKISQTGFIILYGFPSKEIRDSNAKYLDRRFINIYPKDYDSVFGLDYLNLEGENDYKRVYDFIKQNYVDFEGAVDILD